MRVFVPRDPTTTEILNENFYSAMVGFDNMGWEICYYTEGDLPDNLHRADVVIGYISTVKKALMNLQIDVPSEIDYPSELSDFLGRRVWKSTLKHECIKYSDPEYKGRVFIKPVARKIFDGRLIHSWKDLKGLDYNSEQQVWCSDPINFVSEYRCFIRYGQLIGAKQYKGDFKRMIDFSTVQSCIDAAEKLPAGCSLDFGLTEDGHTLLVEVNDGYSLGSYGLNSILYAKLISARWFEMVNMPDPCQF